MPNFAMNHIFQNNFMAALPETFLVTSSIIILLYAVSYQPDKSCSIRPYPVLTSLVGWLCILSLALAMGLCVYQSQTASVGVIFNNALVVDDLTVTIRMLILTSALACIGISFSYIHGQRINS